MSVPAQVFRLESLDTEIEQAEAAMLAIRRKRVSNPQLEAAEARVGRLRENERAAVLSQRQLEAQLTDLEGKIKRDTTRMYSGQIVDSRELSSLERELANYGAQRDLVERQVLEAMERTEAFAEELAASDAAARQTREQWLQSRPASEGEEAHLAARVSTLKQERESVASEISPAVMSAYLRLRAASGHAVTVVRNGVCQWCRVNIPQKDVQHARGGALVYCTNCSRILYAEG